MAIKSVLKIIGYVLAFLISSLIILAFIVDANTFKPRIQSIAQEQGIALSMRGDLHWAFWPAIGLVANDVSVASIETPDKAIADVKKASFLIAFIPLMQGDFQVKHILVDGAAINLEVDEKGVGNWEKLLKKKDQIAAENKPKASSKKSDDLKLSIEKISLHDSQVIYANMGSGQKFSLTNINLDMDDVNLKGQPFDVDFSSKTEISQTKTKARTVAVKTKLHSSVSLSENLNSIALDKGTLNLDVHATDSASIKFEYSLKLEDLKNNLQYQGHLVIPTTNLKQLMTAFGVHHKTANEKALSEFSVGGDFQGDKKRFAFNALNVQLDKTHLKGSLAINDFSSQAITADLQGDEINVDDYLAPKADEKAPVAAKTATGDEPLIPVEMLRKLNVDAKLAFAKFGIVELAFEKVLLTINAKNGVLQEQLNANAYSGSIHQKTQLDSRNSAAQIQFESVLQGIEVAPILQAKKLDKSVHLTGAIQANARGQATGVTKNQIMDSLVANATFSGAKMQLSPINIEQQFCKFIALVNRAEEPTQTWNAYTELHELTGKIAIAKRIVTIETLNAGVHKLLLNSTGNINLANGSYDFSLPLKLIRDANDTATSITTSATGCTVTSNYWAERGMSLLRCKGEYAEINPARDCRPDKDMLNAIVKDFAEYKLRDKYGEKADAKKAELKKKLEEKLGEGGADKAKNALKNLFKKKEDKSQ